MEFSRLYEVSNSVDEHRDTRLDIDIITYESLRRFSSVGREPTGKSEGVGRMWWQRCRNRVNNLDVFDRFNLKIAYASVLFVGCTIYGLMSK
ncbi:unnamed protein product [Urochloa humidicola]